MHALPDRAYGTEAMAYQCRRSDKMACLFLGRYSEKGLSFAAKSRFNFGNLRAGEVATRSVMQANSLDSLEVIPSGAALGTEIRGLDLTQAIPETIAQALKQIWANHMVLLLRG